ncbi:hypothetical protein [Vagococcus jeotgali]|uniref:hypothetical protein n=1 Tax=Vagococcus jeotgali TaxID=3109030 RepID=UPI002DDA697F|nr:hypothetical protein [Vagococcus sp. B2T-5]
MGHDKKSSLKVSCSFIISEKLASLERIRHTNREFKEEDERHVPITIVYCT